MSRLDHDCPLCARPTPTDSLGQVGWQTPETIAQIVRAHPDWQVTDGACPACVQEALLHVLISQGEEALHSRIQQVWPLDAQAAFGAIPTPLRLHADPRFSGQGVTVALIDAGFYPHPDLTQPLNRIKAWVDASREPMDVRGFGPDEIPVWLESDTRHDRQWHGTMTSTVLAGNGQLSHGLYRGLASAAELVLVQVRDNDHPITDAAIVRALNWVADNAAALGIRVVSLSLGGDGEPQPGNPIDNAVQRVVDAGVVVVAAAGNDGVRRLAPPASATAALTVGGIDDHNTVDHETISLWHSNYGFTAMGVAKPELVAPSIWVAAPVLPGTELARSAQHWFAQRQTQPMDSPARQSIERRIAAQKLITPFYQHVDGTSFAAPLAASAVACMVEANPDLSPGLVRQMLTATAQPVPGVSAERQGAGVLAAGPAVARALAHRHPAFAKFATLPWVTAKDVTFLLHHHSARQVQVLGAWDGWRTPIVLRAASPGVWQAVMQRPPPGIYAYKYQLDGQRWLDDPANPAKVWDGFIGFNSLLTID